MSDLLTVAAIETPHLILREMERRDVPELTAFMTQSRYQRHISHKLRDAAMVQDFVARQIAARNDNRRHVFHLAAEEKLTSEVVGDGFIIAHSDGSHELGWGIHPAMWAMGLGTEMAQGLLALGFERIKAKSLWCKVMTPNVASAKLARRVGMRHVEAHADYRLGTGALGAVDIFRISVGEYFDLPY